MTRVRDVTDWLAQELPSARGTDRESAESLA